ncbi:hypothetical protein ACFE04_019252 [Oxalis oulophora]
MVEPSFPNSQSIHHGGVDDVDDVLIEEPKLESHIGMIFDSLDEATQFYKEFSRRQGFGFRIRSSKPNFCHYVCSSEGFNALNLSNNKEDKILKVACSMETEMLADKETPLLGSNIQTSMDDQVQLNELPKLNIGDPRKSNTKGRKKDDQKETHNKRLKSGLELSCSQSGVKKRKCKKRGEYGHYQTSCKK